MLYDVYIHCTRRGHKIDRVFYKTVKLDNLKCSSSIKFVTWDTVDKIYDQYKEVLPFKYKKTILGKKVRLKGSLFYIKQWRGENLDIVLRFDYIPLEHVVSGDQNGKK